LLDDGRPAGCVAWNPEDGVCEDEPFDEEQAQREKFDALYSLSQDDRADASIDDDIGADVDCADFATHREAQDFFRTSGGPAYDPYGLDRDGDGSACELLP
jgi:micrococcal nuclease